MSDRKLIDKRIFILGIAAIALVILGCFSDDQPDDVDGNSTVVSSSSTTDSQPKSTPKSASEIEPGETVTMTATSSSIVAAKSPTPQPSAIPSDATPASATPVPIVPLPTGTPIPTAVATGQPIVVPTVSPSPTNPVATTVIVEPTVATPTQLPPSPTVLPTLTPTPSPTVTPTTTITPVVTPTPFWTPIPPNPTSTPIGTADSRYGLIVGGRDNSEAAYFTDALDVSWYLDYGAGVSVSNNVNKLRVIMLESGIHPYSDADISAMVTAAPGSYFQIGNEPNIFGDTANLPAGYADALNYYVTRIKTADPTAVIVGPNILNFDFTCIGCGGYTAGHTWLDQMRTSYLDKYGVEPPIDIWALHQYPLDWFNFPTVNDAILTQDLDAFRSYLDTIPGHSGAEIWVTEFGLHWGFEGLQFQHPDTLEPCATGGDSKCYPGPIGEYKTDAVIGFLDRLTLYYEANSTRLKLKKWFLWRNHHNFGPNPSGTNGLTLFDSYYQGGTLTEVGTAYRNLIFRD